MGVAFGFTKRCLVQSAGVFTTNLVRDAVLSRWGSILRSGWLKPENSQTEFAYWSGKVSILWPCANRPGKSTTRLLAKLKGTFSSSAYWMA